MSLGSPGVKDSCRAGCVNKYFRFIARLQYSWVSLCKYAVNLSGGQPQLY